MKLNHRFWKLIFLLAIRAGLELGMTVAHGEVAKQKRLTTQGDQMAKKSKRRMLVECKNYPGRCRHHLTPKSVGGSRDTDNLLLLSLNKHAAWHTLFHGLTIEQAIQLLVRVHRLKGRCLYGAMGKPCNLAPCLDAPKNGHRPGRQIFKMIHS